MTIHDGNGDNAGKVINKSDKPLLLMILDGWGLCTGLTGDALSMAATPNFDRLWSVYPHTALDCSGGKVGLPHGQMGNSEVGHAHIGAGRVMDQDLVRISKSVDDGSFFDNPVLVWAMDRAKQRGTALHLMGLVSDGGVHSMDTHLYALLEMAKRRGLKRVYIHCFTDGRDTAPDSAVCYIKELQEKIGEIGVGEIASICGRFFAMDRDKRWDRISRAYRALIFGDAPEISDAERAVRDSYAKEITDEFIEPVLINSGGGEWQGNIKNDDSVIFFNYRADRARELSHALCDGHFDYFDRGQLPTGLHYVCMTSYDETIKASVAFLPISPESTLGNILAMNNMRQLRIAETEKYAHVTFFFNGGQEGFEHGEDRILIPSPLVKTYDQKPEMSAYQITDAVLERIENGNYDVIILNYANPDMLGHTGNIPATVKALEVVDECIGRVERALRRVGGAMIITADHGNVEKMLDEFGNKMTSHTTGKVPFILVHEGLRDAVLASDGGLSNIAPTVLQILGIKHPGQMTGTSLIKNADEIYNQLRIDF